MNEFPLCQSCGRPMKTLHDFPRHDRKSMYCSLCTDKDGNLEAFEEVLRNYINYLLATETEDVQEALAKARAVLPMQSAWHGEWKNMTDDELLEDQECRI